MNLEEITKYIFLEDTDPSGDIALVFGTWDAWKESVDKAAALYKIGLVPKIIVSGGANPKSGVVEGDLMAKELKKVGVPEIDILRENRSRNTLENVLFSKEIIEREIGLKNIHTIVAVVKNFHARRALMTLRKHMPSHIQLRASAYVSLYYNFSKDNWWKSSFGKEQVLGEVKKIEAYLAKGDIKDFK